jgi:hypothetical protein
MINYIITTHLQILVFLFMTTITKYIFYALSMNTVILRTYSQADEE